MAASSFEAFLEGLTAGAVDFADSTVESVSPLVKAGLDAAGSLWDSGFKGGDGSLGQSKYDFTQHVFPSDLVGEQSFNQHWMLININVKDASAFTGAGTGGVLNSTVLPGELSKVDALRSTIDRATTSTPLTATGRQGLGTLASAFGGGHDASSLLVPRRTTRIAESIAIYMPGTQVFSQINDYSETSMTTFVTDLASKPPIVGPIIGAYVNKRDTINAVSQRPINPRVEVLFNNTALREFQYDFLFAPANEEETTAMKNIIRTLRFHAAPEYTDVSADDAFGGFLWVPPSEFDITFMKGTTENLNLPRINTCALIQTDVDYAPTGVYSTFRDGTPVKVRLQLRFREVEVLHKLRVLQGF